MVVTTQKGDTKSKKRKKYFKNRNIVIYDNFDLFFEKILI